jgi:hypothetical protein
MVIPGSYPCGGSFSRLSYAFYDLTYRFIAGNKQEDILRVSSCLGDVRVDDLNWYFALTLIHREKEVYTLEMCGTRISKGVEAKCQAG